MRHPIITISSLCLLAGLSGCAARDDEGIDGGGITTHQLVQGGVTGELRITSQWNVGFCATVAVRNDTGTTGSSWRLVGDLGGATITQSWNTTVSQSGAGTAFGPVAWNATIPSGSEQNQAGFCATTGSRAVSVTLVQVLDASGNPIVGPTGTGGAGTGGAATGGAATGGAATGGAATGGAATGGAATGGAATGGAATGGAATGGAGGALGTPISPLLVGNNVWYNPDAAVFNASAGAKLKIVRIGGIQYDNTVPSNAQLTAWVNAIKAMGAEPLVQVSQYKGAAAAAALVTYFNVTTRNPVKYWNIGNEPWLERGKPPTSTMAPIVAGYVKPIASAMKAVDPTIKIYAPDECDYIEDMYNALLGGSSDITGKDANGRYYIDGISWHRYVGGDLATSGANDIITRIAKTRARVDYANKLNGRTGSNALGFGIGEFNANAGNAGGGVCTFANGQMVGQVYGAMMKYGGTYATLWSMKEGGSSCGGTDFGFLNGDNSPRPSFYHMQLVSTHFTGGHVDGKSSVSNIRTFGAVDTGKIAVMLMNVGATSQTCNVRLNTDPVSGTCQVNVSAGTPVTVTQAIGANTSMVLVFSRQGRLTQRITYASGSAPKTENL